MSTAESSYAPSPGQVSSPSVTVILAIAILIFFFVGFFSIYFCRCVMENIVTTWHLRRSPSGNLVTVACASAHQGLDASQIQTFPTFRYSTVKDLRRDDYGLECAICLSEFENESLLRLLTVCYHVFHQECIDLWLESHKTCPVCRRVLDPSDDSFGKASPQTGHEDAGGEADGTAQEALPSASPRNEALQQSEVRIDVRDEEGDREHNVEESSNIRGGGEVCDQGKLLRSHTTGHSIRKTREEDDRYTLRLPEHVRSRLLRGHNWTGSCTTFGDISKNMASHETYGEAGFSGGDINKS